MKLILPSFHYLPKYKLVPKRLQYNFLRYKYIDVLQYKFMIATLQKLYKTVQVIQKIIFHLIVVDYYGTLW